MFLSKMECRSLIILFPARKHPEQSLWNNANKLLHLSHIMIMSSCCQRHHKNLIQSSWVSCNQATPTSTQKPHHEPFPQCPSTSCSWRRFLNKQASLSHQLSKASSTAPFCSVAGCCMKSVKAGDFWVWTGLQFYSLKVLVMIHCGDVML